MKNLIYKDDSYIFTGLKIKEDNFGYELVLTENKVTADEKYLYPLTMILQDKENLETGSHPLFSVQDFINFFEDREDSIYDFKDFLKDYGFPEFYEERNPYIKLDGAISDNNSQWKIIYPKSVTSLGIIEPLELDREGFILRSKIDGEIYGSLKIFALKTFLLIEEANRNWKNLSQEEKYNYVQKIQETAKKENIQLDNSLNIKIIIPEKIVPQLNDDNGKLRITADVNINELEDDSFKTRFEGLNLVPNIYNAKDKEGNTVKVLFNNEQKQVLQDIKNNKNSTEEEIKEFLKNPPENWNDEIVDSSELYSDRVLGWIETVETWQNSFSQSDTDWFGDANQEDLGINLLNGEYKEKELKTKKMLVLKDNEDEVDYEQIVNENLKDYKFPNIPGGYKKGIMPKPYQKEGIAWLYSGYVNKSSGCILADDMGLGKTFQVLSFLQSLSEENKLVLLIAPASLISNWEDEYYKFFNKVNFRINNHNASMLESILTLQNNGEEITNSQLIITSYEKIRSKANLYMKINWDVIVLDEAQRIKNSKSLTNSTIRGLKSEFRIAITGTPVENSLSDIWAIADFIIPGKLGSHYDFRKKYEVGADTSDELIKTKGIELRKELGMCFLRRTKSDMLKDLPEKKIISLAEEMPPIQQKVYKTVLANKFNVKKLSQQLELLQYLRKSSEHYRLLDNLLGDIFVNQPLKFEDTAKSILLKKLLYEIKERNEKVIIFAEYLKIQEILQQLIYKEFNIYPSIYNGKVPVNSRQKLLNKFKEKEGFNVIIMSPIAAGVGLTITEANHVIHYSRHWNPAKEDQATDRVYRIGQTKKVFVYNLIGKIDGIQTFDEKLDALLSRKQNIKGAALFPSNRLEITNEDFIQDIM